LNFIPAPQLSREDQLNAESDARWRNAQSNQVEQERRAAEQARERDKPRYEERCEDPAKTGRAFRCNVFRNN
jgi:hypothetical protein